MNETGGLDSFPQFPEEYEFQLVWFNFQARSRQPVQAREVTFSNSGFYLFPVVSAGEDSAVVYVNT